MDITPEKRYKITDNSDAATKDFTAFANRSPGHYEVKNHEIPDLGKIVTFRVVEGFLEPWLADKLYRHYLNSDMYKKVKANMSPEMPWYHCMVMATEENRKRRKEREENQDDSLDKVTKKMLKEVSKDVAAEYDAVKVFCLQKYVKDMSLLHSDRGSAVAISLGPPRKFTLYKRYNEEETKIEITLCHGDAVTVVNSSLGNWSFDLLNYKKQKHTEYPHIMMEFYSQVFWYIRPEQRARS